MPMDKFTRQCQRSKLWAHRRNTTADQSLVGQLRHMEQTLNRNNKQYHRDRIRLQSELSDLAQVLTLTEDETAQIPRLGRPNTGTHTGTPHPCRPTSENIRTSGPDSSGHVQLASKMHRKSSPNRTIGLNLLSCEKSSENRCSDKATKTTSSLRLSREATNNKAEKNISPDLRAVSSLSSISCRTERGTMCSGPRQERCRSVVTSTPVEKATMSGDIGDDHHFWDVTSENSSVCRYSLSRSPDHTCQYFPCTIPTTYHALGSRRNDLAPWVTSARGRLAVQDDAINEAEAPNMRKEEPILRLEQNTCHLSQPPTGEGELRVLRFSNKKDHLINLNIMDNNFTSKSDNFIFRNRPKSVQFQPFVQGPIFAPKPSDPILEHVRQGSVKPLTMCSRVKARVSVNDKMRGLRQLVREMRARHQQTKPQDWAVNYGQRVPTRILLNPVVPVSIYDVAKT